jgi:hypothetical protein
MTYTASRTESNGQISSVARFTTLSQAKAWAASNGHVIVKGYAAKKAISSGAPVRMIRPDGRVDF